MKRKQWIKPIVSLCMTGALLFPLVASAAAPAFKDVDSSSPYAVYIQDLKQEGIVNGKAEGSFVPGDAATRGEFVKMIVLGFQLPPDQGHFHFADMNKHWAAQYVQTAWNQGIVEGVKAESFLPDARISREEAAVIVWRLLEAKGVKPSVINFMLPNTVDVWAREGVSQCMAKRLFGVPFAAGTYRDALTREEAAALVDLSVKWVADKGN